MFFVVVGHYIYHGVKPQSELTAFYQFNSFMGVINWISMEALYVISTVAVNCFVMISGYFLIYKSDLRWNGILKIWMQTFFYSMVFLAISYLTGSSIGEKELGNSFFPILGKQYWFVGIYIGLMFLAPFISLLTQCLNQKGYLLLLGIMFVMNSQYLYGAIYGGYDSLFWFSFLFLVGGYIKKYGIPQKIVANKGVLLLLVWFSFVAVAFVFNLPGGGKFVSSSYHGFMFFLSFSVFVFFAFTKMECKGTTLIVKGAPYCFGVYLIHANPFLHERIWAFFIPDMYRCPMFIHCLFSSVVIFVVCVIIDKIRDSLFKFIHIPQLISLIAKKLPQVTYSQQSI